MDVASVSMFTICIIIAIYLLPWMIAVMRGHRACGAIFITNLLLGWSGIIWLVTLIWALNSNTNSNNNQKVIIIEKYHK